MPLLVLSPTMPLLVLSPTNEAAYGYYHQQDKSNKSWLTILINPQLQGAYLACGLLVTTPTKVKPSPLTLSPFTLRPSPFTLHPSLFTLNLPSGI